MIARDNTDKCGPREVYLRGGPMDGQIIMVDSARHVRYARQELTDPRSYVVGTYTYAGRWMSIRWDLPDDGSLDHPDVFVTGMGRLVANWHVFDWAGENP